MSRSKQGAWTGGSTRHFSPRKPHRKGSKKRSSAVSPVAPPGAGARGSNHIADDYLRGLSGGSADLAALIASLSNQSKVPGS